MRSKRGENKLDPRKVYDAIPEQFDTWRPRYCGELFNDLIEYSQLDSSRSALEIGPGTGQATEPILKTGCSYSAIELGEHLAEFMQNRFSSYKNFHIENADFETYDFGERKFDLVFSAATIQWIPEKIAFPKVFDLLKRGGTLAMTLTRTEYKNSNEALYNRIQEAYTRYFRPETEYTCNFTYGNAVLYGFADLECRNYRTSRIFTADEYISYIGTHCDHIMLSEPNKSMFYSGIRDAIRDSGDTIKLDDTITLYLTRKY